MLSNFIVSIEAVLPMFLLVLLGLYIRKRRFLDKTELAHLNKLIFNVFFFFMMFNNLYRLDLGKVVHPDLMLFCGLGVIAVCLIASFVVCALVKDNYRRGAMVHGIYRSNYFIMGMPIVANIFGPDSLAVPSIMIAVVVPLYNILAVVVFETFRGGSIKLGPVLKGIATNPMIVGGACGFAVMLLGISLPAFVMKPVAQVASLTSSLALIVLGASFNASSSLADKKTLLALSMARLLIVPSVMLLLAGLIGYRGIEYVTVLAVFSPPCAVAGFAMAQQLNSDYVLAGNLIVTTSALSVFTIFLLVFVSKILGMF